MSISGKKQTVDPQQGLFASLAHAPIITAKFSDVGLLIRAALVHCITSSPLKRYDITARISELIDREVTKDMLDKYTAESAKYHRVPADLIPAICYVTQCNEPIEVLARACAGRFSPPAETLAAELEKLKVRRQALDQEIHDVEQQMKGQRR